VTRLEPPFIICIIILFVAQFLFSSRHQNTLCPSFLASITYSHAAVFPDVPPINPVTWSLEVEVQYYLLAPLLALRLRRLHHYSLLRSGRMQPKSE
jgi:peptidoglycan/LPS O-acetylase OafA/YrhL